MPSTDLMWGDVADQVISTLPDYGPVDYHNIAGLHDYETWRKMMRKHKMEMNGGLNWKRTVQIKHSDSARWRGVYGKDEFKFADVMADLSVDLRVIQGTTPINMLDIAANTGKAQIRPRQKSLLEASAQALMEKIELTAWALPSSSSATDALYGPPHWAPLPTSQVTLTDDSSSGFTGGDPPGFTGGAANLPVATTAHWNSYADIFASVDMDDFVARFAKAAWEVDFETPTELSSMATGGESVCYTVYSMQRALEVLARQQNDQVGYNVGGERNKMMLFGLPVKALKSIAAQSYASRQPLWLVNWGAMKTIYRSGWFMKTIVKDVSDDCLTKAIHKFMCFNWVCIDRKRLACLAKAA